MRTSLLARQCEALFSALPNGALRYSEGRFATLASTSGLANPLSNTRRMGREMAERVKQLGIDAELAKDLELGFSAFRGLLRK